jgi:AcrR family transcriptional regulator
MSAEQRREHILAASALSLAANGYADTSMDDIALAAGISKPVLYDHFASKEVLYLDLLRWLRDRLLSAGKDMMVQAPSVEEGTEAAVSFLFRFAQSSPHEAILLFTPPQGEPTITAAARTIQDEATRHLANMILSAFPNIEQSSASIHAEFLKTGLHGAILWWLRNPQMPLEEAKAAVLSILWSGMSRYARA